MTITCFHLNNWNTKNNFLHRHLAPIRFSVRSCDIDISGTCLHACNLSRILVNGSYTAIIWWPRYCRCGIRWSKGISRSEAFTHLNSFWCRWYCNCCWINSDLLHRHFKPICFPVGGLDVDIGGTCLDALNHTWRANSGYVSVVGTPSDCCGGIRRCKSIAGLEAFAYIYGLWGRWNGNCCWIHRTLHHRHLAPIPFPVRSCGIYFSVTCLNTLYHTWRANSGYVCIARTPSDCCGCIWRRKSIDGLEAFAYIYGLKGRRNGDVGWYNVNHFNRTSSFNPTAIFRHACNYRFAYRL